MSFIDDFLDYTQGIASPQIFRRWSALTLVAGAMERKCYMTTSSGQVFPNLFVLLVAPPGVGKSQVIGRVRDLWAATGKLKLAPQSVTRAALEDSLSEATQVISNTGSIYHSLQVAAPEFGTFVKAHDLEFLNTLNDLYDCNDYVDFRTRGRGEERIDKPQISIIAGTQPHYLAEVLPSTAFGMGFTSRLIMVFAAEKVKVSIFGHKHQANTSRKHLVNELADIASTYGEFLWEESAQQALEDWYDRDLEPEPDHPKLQSYKSRRLINILKLSMAASMAESRELVVRKHHLDEAAETLLGAEAEMPEIFRDMQSSGHSDVINETWNYVRAKYMRNEKKPVRENEIHAFLQQRVPAYQISSVIDSMIKSGWIETVVSGPEGMRKFKPKVGEEAT